MPNKPNFSSSTDTSDRRRRTLYNVTEFPKASGAETWDAGLTIIFQLDDQRFEVGWNVTELNHKPAEVVPISKQRQRNGGSRSCKAEPRKR
jgi:hypothetical protein